MSSSVLHETAERVGRASRAVKRAVADQFVQPLTREDEAELAREYDAARGFDRPLVVRAKEAQEHAEGAPVVTWTPSWHRA